MTRERLDRVVEEWEKIGLYFDEHAYVAASVLSGKPESGGLHGVLKHADGFRPVKGRLSEAMSIAERNNIYLFVDVEADGERCLWGGAHKVIRIRPTEVECALIPKEMLQQISSKSESLRKIVSRSLSYQQEDAKVLRVDEKLILMERQIKECIEEVHSPMPLMLKTKLLRRLVKRVMEDTAFEEILREQLDEPLQQEAATTICEGIRFLHSFR